MAEIPINAAVPRNQWTATAAQTVFAYEWPIFDEADIVITQTDDISGVVTVLAITADYTVQNVGAENGGTITLVSGALVDDIITLYRSVIIKRLADFEASGDFRSATLNREMDIFTMIMQEAARDWARAILLDPSDPTTGLIIPLPAERAGKFIAFSNDATAQLIVAESIPDTAVVSAFGATLIDDADADTAKATLQIFNADGGITFEYTDDGAGEGPAVVADRISTSPLQSDLLGSFIWRGRNDAAEEIDYAKILAGIADVTDGSEDGFLRVYIVRGGAEVEILRLIDGMQIGLPTGGDKGAGTLNVANGLYDNDVRLVLPRGAINGLILSNNTTDAAKDIDIAVGEAVDDGGAVMMKLTSALTKRLDESWAVGTDAGALDGTESVAGTPDADTWYHIWEIQRSDTGVVDILASESATAPTMPTNYDRKRRIGAVLFDATPDILAFHQFGDEFFWKSRIQDVNTTTPSLAGVSAELSVPLGISVIALLNVSTNVGTPSAYMLVTAVDGENEVPSDANFDVGSDTDSTRQVTEIKRPTNTSGEIRYRSSDASVTFFRIKTLGWIDPRGRNS